MWTREELEAMEREDLIDLILDMQTELVAYAEKE